MFNHSKHLKIYLKTKTKIIKPLFSYFVHKIKDDNYLFLVTIKYVSYKLFSNNCDKY